MRAQTDGGSSEYRLFVHETGQERIYASIDELPPEARDLLERGLRGEVDGAAFSSSESFIIESPGGTSRKFTSMGEALRYIGARTEMDVDGPLQPGTRVFVRGQDAQHEFSLARALMKPIIGLIVVGLLYVAFKLGWVTP